MLNAIKKLRTESDWIGLFVSMCATVDILNDTRIPEEGLRAGIAEMHREVQEKLGDTPIMELINEAVKQGRKEMGKG